MIAPAALALALTLAVPAPPAATSDGCAGAAAASAALGEWCAALAARPRLPVATAADHQALQEVFARPELRRARADTAGLRRWLAGLWARVLELLGSAEAERYAVVGRTAFLAGVLAAALATLAALRRRRARDAARPAATASARAAVPPPDRSAALADRALGAGDFAGAVRHAFLSALGALEASGRLPRDRTLTNRELADRLPGPGPLAEEFGALRAAFDGAIYGGAAIDAPAARDCVARAGRIRASAGGTK